MHTRFLIPVAAFSIGTLTGAVAVGAYERATAARSVEIPATVPGGMAIRPDAVRPEPAPSVRVVETVPRDGAESPSLVTVTPRAPGSDELAAKIQGMAAGWHRLTGELAQLRERVVGLERRLAAPAENRVGQTAGAGERARSPQDKRAALEAAGVSTELASELVWLQAQQELDHLELRDQALREGWFGSDRYGDEMRRIGEEQPDLRTSLGDDAYDRYLYAAGEDNRVQIEGVIPGSAAEEVGLQPGDMIETYDGERVFTFAELRTATSGGERGELVPLLLRRADGSVVETWVSRGPLGVRLDLTRAEPGA